MKFDALDRRVRIFGDLEFRGKCPLEEDDQITFFNKLRTEIPALGAIAIHPRNEQMLKGGHHRALIRYRAEGMTTGAADIIIPAAPAFVCEMKRQDHTRCHWQAGQIEYLSACAGAGAYTCVALGWASAWAALETWRKLFAE